MDESLICSYHLSCSGCSDWKTSFEEQFKIKVQTVLDQIQTTGLQIRPSFDQILIDSSHFELKDRGLRDRLDFQILNGKWGLWDQKKEDLVDVDICLQLSPHLQAWLSDFRKINIPIEKGSFRLRVCPEGQRGLWMDFSNEDIKKLFEEKITLQKLEHLALVEIGQRRKALVFQNGKPQLLKEPRLHAWNRTWVDEKPFPLFSRIADFSQVGDQANFQLIQALTSLLRPGQQLLEFGSGNGNLSFPASSFFEKVHCFESDQSVALGFLQSLQNLNKIGQKKSIQLHVGHQHALDAFWPETKTVLVNPPRSGVGTFLKDIKQSPAENLIYMSCYPESMTKDLIHLGKNWVCEKMIFIDQFPHTSHVETLSSWLRI